MKLLTTLMKCTKPTVLLALLWTLSSHLTAQAPALTADGTTDTLQFLGTAQDLIIPNTSAQYIVFTLNGGDGGRRDCSSGGKGGDGATLTVSFPVGPQPNELHTGDTIRFVVGQRGESQNSFDGGGAGGGGGTALLLKRAGAQIPAGSDTVLLDVVNSADTAWILLAVAGGGGGGFGERVNEPFNQQDCDDDTSKNGTGGNDGTSGRSGGGNNDGGTDGQGGLSGSDIFDGGAGGGALSNGNHPVLTNRRGRRGGISGGDGGGSGGVNGTVNGGWGYGGGGAGIGDKGAGGGGGGFSGGGGGNDGNAAANNGGGGGSYVNPIAVSGSVLIEAGGTTKQAENGFIAYSFPTITANGDIEKVELQRYAQDFIIPTDLDLSEFNTITFTARGGDGGRVETKSLNPRGGQGGEGALITAAFRIGNGIQELKPGGTLRLIVGEEGRSQRTDQRAGGGGGGGTAVLYRPPGIDDEGDCMVSGAGGSQSGPTLNIDEDCWSILLVAGGGGGGWISGESNGTGRNGLDANTETNGTTNGDSGDGEGGTSGNSGETPLNSNEKALWGGGGGGYRPLFPEGTERLDVAGSPGIFTGGPGGTARSDFFEGGYGYGGGGSGARNGAGNIDDGGGGGGGFSGGGGGRSDPGGGGGSYVNTAAISFSKEEAPKTAVSLDGWISYQFYLRANAGPKAICKSTITASIPGNGEFELTPEMVDGGSINADGTTDNLDFTFSIILNSGEVIDIPKFTYECRSVGTVDTEVLRVTDASGQDSFCEFSVNIVQGDAESLTCPPSQTVELLGNQCQLILEDGESFRGELIALRPASLPICAAALDYEILRPDHTLEMDFIDDNSEQGILSDEFMLGENQISYRSSYTDADGFETVEACSFSITVKASTDPILIECPVNLEVEVPNSQACEATVLHTNSSKLIAAYDGPGDLSYQVTSPGTDPTIVEGIGTLSTFDFELGESIVTYTASCDGQELTHCDFTVTVNKSNNAPPVLECIEQENRLNLSVAAGNSTAELLDQLVISATDDCGIDSLKVLYSIFDLVSPEELDCNDVGESASARVLATDIQGETTECSVRVTLIDDIGVTCPPSITVASDPDICSATVEAALLSTRTNYYCLSTLEYDVTYQEDEAIQTLSNGSGEIPDQTFPGPGIYTINYSAQSTSDQTSNCAFQVTVQDTQAPVATCTNIEVNLGTPLEEVSSALGQGSTDNCGITSYALDLDLSCPNVGYQAVTLTVSDAAGNEDLCIGLILLKDNNPPVFDCADFQLLVETNPGTCNFTLPDVAERFISLGRVSDDCGEFSVMQSIAIGTVIYEESTVVTLEAEDEYGNEATPCEVLVRRQDLELPSMQCQAVTITLNSEGQATVNIGDVVVVSDNCDPAPFVSFDPLVLQTEHTFTCDQLGDNSRRVYATDNSLQGNSNFCTATITVMELDLSAECQDATVILDSNGNGTLNLDDIDAGSGNSCDNFTLSLAEEALITTLAFDCADIGTTNVSLYVEDENGNTSSCNSTISVQDNTPPQPTCQDIIVELDDAGNGTIIPNLIASATDNCGIATESIDISTVDCTALDLTDPTVLVTYTVQDVNGNENTCTATATIEDNIPPVASCNDITVELNQLGIATINPAMIGSGTDNCGIALEELDIQAFDCSNITGLSGSELPILVTYSILDVGGNTATCTAEVTVEDNLSPSLTCRDITITIPYDETTGFEAVEVSFSDLLLDFQDNCTAEPEGEDMTFSFADCDDLGTHEIDVILEDEAGNPGSCTSTVNVVEGIAPNARCRTSRAILIDESGVGILTPDFLNFGSLDNCSIVNYSFSPDEAITSLSYTCEDIGDYTVSLYLQDQSGNTSSCSSLVRVRSKVSVACKDITVQLSNPILTPEDAVLAASDGCYPDDELMFCVRKLSGGSSNPFTCSALTLDCEELGDTDYFLQAKNLEGLTDVCIFTVSVIDDAPPVANCQDVTVQLDIAGLGNLSPEEVDNGSTDECGVDMLSLDQTSFTCIDIGDHTVELTVKDINGNESSCTATASIVDAISPSLDCLSNIGVNTDTGECGAYVDLPTPGISDNCSTTGLQARYREVDAVGNPLAAWSNWAVDPSGFFEVGSYEIQWNVQDQSGNEGFCSVELEVLDEELPELVCKDISVAFNGEAALPIPTVSIFDAAASFDACGEVSFLSQGRTEVSCSEIGQTVAVEVIGVDPNGNSNTCTAYVTITGMPCGFEATDVDCAEGADANYDPANQSFTLTATDCPGYPDGKSSFVGTTLCGDGEIIAHMADLDLNARAGVVMMENTDGGAKMVGIVKEVGRRIRTEYRSSPNANISSRSKTRSGVNWLRIVRSGNKFKTYTSTNGSFWRVAHSVNFPSFAECLQVGLYVYTKSSSQSASAVFDQVEIIHTDLNPLETGPSELSALSDLTEKMPSEPVLTAAPNPFSIETKISFTLQEKATTHLSIFNLHGQRIQSWQLGELDKGEYQQIWDATAKGKPLPSGLYFIRLQYGEHVVTKRVILQSH